VVSGVFSFAHRPSKSSGQEKITTWRLEGRRRGCGAIGIKMPELQRMHHAAQRPTNSSVREALLGPPQSDVAEPTEEPTDGQQTGCSCRILRPGAT
jgi:hypothetical protein